MKLFNVLFIAFLSMNFTFVKDWTTDFAKAKTEAAANGKVIRPWDGLPKIDATTFVTQLK
jgi:hypothetical protein